MTNQLILNDLAELPRDRWFAIDYDAFLKDTPAELERLCRFADIAFGPRMQEMASGPLKPSKYTLTPPQPDKWKKNAAELETVLPVTDELMATLQAL